EGEPFDPYFYRSGKRQGEREWEVDGDFFLEVPVRESDRTFEVAWQGGRRAFERPDPLGDVHFLTVEEWSEEGEVVAVLLPRQGFGGWLRALLSRRPLEVLASSAHPLTPPDQP